MKRRGFFQSLAKAAAIIALAPQLAFRTKAEVFGPELLQYSITVNFGTGGDGEPIIRTWKYMAPEDHENEFICHNPAIVIEKVLEDSPMAKVAVIKKYDITLRPRT